ncbi:MAG TPA: chemotaxis protein CheW [Gemmatimonadaceae bacterium]|nr:chemotaxis protein CheW [Gemmatimonadaceae bacterium]
MTTATSQQVVTFRVGDEHFAADVLAVERVLRHAAPMPVPNLPDWMEGVLEYQSRVVPVIDLRRRFGLDEDGRPQTGVRIIVFRAGDEWLGALVDAVLEVVNIDPAHLSPPPPLFRGLKAEYVRGLLRRDGRMIILLEMARLLTATEHLELQRASQGGAPSDG